MSGIFPVSTPLRPNGTKSICAVVVAFFPDEGFEDRLRVLLPQVGMLVVVDNTPKGGCAQRLKGLKENGKLVHVIENRSNVGVAAALNQGLERALQRGYEWILTLDQDTQCYPDMVRTLARVCAAYEPTPAVIGGNYLDPRDGRLKVPAGRAEEFLEQKTVITSGSLVDAKLAHAIGGFREDYFIDQLDHEFCLRVRAHGRRVVISRKPVMIHSVGGPDGPRVPFLGIVLPSHPPLRKYYIARNSIVTVAKYWRQEPEWCVRRLVRLLLGLGSMALLERDRIAKVWAFCSGFADGLRQYMGPCRHERLY